MRVRRARLEIPKQCESPGQERLGQKSDGEPEARPKCDPGDQGRGHSKNEHLSKDDNMASRWLISELCTALDGEGTDQEASLWVPLLDTVTTPLSWLPIGRLWIPAPKIHVLFPQAFTPTDLAQDTVSGPGIMTGQLVPKER